MDLDGKIRESEQALSYIFFFWLNNNELLYFIKIRQPDRGQYFIKFFFKSYNFIEYNYSIQNKELLTVIEYFSIIKTRSIKNQTITKSYYKLQKFELPYDYKGFKMSSLLGKIFIRTLFYCFLYIWHKKFQNRFINPSTKQSLMK